jgi:hypothetical protein
LLGWESRCDPSMILGFREGPGGCLPALRIAQVVSVGHAAMPQLLNKSFRERFGTVSIASDAAASAMPWLRFGEFVLA